MGVAHVACNGVCVCVCQVGDTVLYNGDIVNDEGPMTNKIQRMIAGVVTAIVDPGTLAIFKA